MPRLLGIDVGTTKIAAVVVDSASGRSLAVASAPNHGQLPAAEGRSEWAARRMIDQAFAMTGEVLRAAPPVTDPTKGRKRWIR